MSRKSKAAEFIDDVYQINITGRNLPVTDALRSYVVEKVLKIEKFHPRVVDVQVNLSVQKLVHRTDIIMKIGHLTIRCTAVDRDMYAAIDEATDKIINQIRRYKSKIQDHHARGLNSIDMNVNVLKPREVAELEEVNDAIEEANQDELINSYRPHHIVSRETKLLKHLTIDEAIVRLELSGDVFLVFRAIEDNKLKVLYRRDDGDYGLIEAEA